MKKQLILFVVALLPACSVEIETATPEIPQLIVTATLEGSLSTKTMVQDGGSQVYWDVADEICVFYNGDGNHFVSQNTEAAKVATFSGSFSSIVGSNGSSTAENPIWGLYPYREDARSDIESVTTVLPSEQIGRAGSFARNTQITLAKSSNLNLAFYNVTGGLRFSLTQEGIKKVSFQGNKGEKIAGTIKMAYAEGVPVVQEITDGNAVITLSAPSGEAFLPGQWYYLIAIPMALSDGFKMTFYKDNEVAEVNSDKPVSIKRGVFGSLEQVDAGLAFSVSGELEETIPPDNEIWYTTQDGKKINLEASYPSYNSQPFNTPVVSHTYENGKGIIRCSEAITTLNDHVFSNGMFSSITNIFLPNSVIYLRTGALRGLHIKELRLPNNLNYVGSYALNIPTLERFIGNNVTADGRCVLFEECLAPNWGNTTQKLNGYLAAFAPAGLASYELPSETRIIGWYAFSWCPELKEIKFNEGLKTIMGEGCSRNNYDCDIYLPSSLESIGPYAFLECKGIHGFYGNDRFFTPDHLCLVTSNKTYLEKFVGEDISDYTIPDGISGIENYAFHSLQNLKSITLPSSIVSVGSYAFHQCDNLEAIYGECTDPTHKALVFGTQFRRLVLSKGITEYTIPEGITSLGYNSFSECPDLKTVIVSDSVTELGGYDFAWCSKLEKVVLSSNLKKINLQNPFLRSNHIKEIYFRSFLPPAYSDRQFYESDCQNLTIYVPEETLELYKNASQWDQYAPYMVGYKYDDIGEWNPDYYMSTDYSADGLVSTLQQSTVGAGVDLVLMGDAFSDRQIADGTYGNVMQKAVNAFFSQEPYESMKDRFNVYTVNVVSATEGYEHIGQALSTAHGGGTYVYGNDNKVIEYTKKAIGEDRMDDALVIVMMNEDAYAGTCFMYDCPSGDYGRGLSIAYFPTSSDTDTFNGLVSHEAGGHGFAKLADEYAYEYNGAISDDAIANTRVNETYGWWKNVDFTNDLSQVKWSQFLNDERYAGEGLGCYEGGLTYWTGVWRPTENSIMRHNTGGFNAPSRYAIWYRINKLAYGENWNGTYEDFVAFDAPNRTPAAAARRAAKRANYVEKQFQPLAPPVVVGHGWREELVKKR